jgi:hypothetical protein
VQFNIETERETDGRWIAEMLDVPGVMAYGKTEEKAREKVRNLAVRAVATSPASTSYRADPRSPSKPASS